MYVRVLRLIACVAVAATTVVMWYPQRTGFGLNLGSVGLQSFCFAVTMLLGLLAWGGRLRSDPYFEFRSGIWDVSLRPIRRNVTRICIGSLLFALLLECGQVMLPGRHGAFGDFMLIATALSVGGGVSYLLAARAVGSQSGRRILRRFLTLD